MVSLYGIAIGLLWGAWSVYWFIGESKLKAVARRESAASRASHLASRWLLAWPCWQHPLPAVRG